MTRSVVAIDSSAPGWARHFETDINRVFAQIERIARPRFFLTADLPLDGSETVAIVTDDGPDVSLGFFDGTNWRRSTDRGIIV